MVLPTRKPLPTPLQLETDFAVSKEFLPRGFSEKNKKRQEKPMGKLSPRRREGVVLGFGWHPIGLTFRWVDAVMPCQRDPNRRSKLVENDSLISPVYDKDTILINKDDWTKFCIFLGGNKHCSICIYRFRPTKLLYVRRRSCCRKWNS